MNIRDLHDPDLGDDEPPSTDLFAGEYALGVLDPAQRREAQQRIARDPGFARLVADWEQRLAPLLAEFDGAEVPRHVWPRIRNRLGWPAIETAIRSGLWQNTGFWRAATGLAAAAAVAVIAIGPFGLLRDSDVITSPGPVVVVSDPPAPVSPKPVTTLARDDGSPGWLASVDATDGTVLMVPVPAPADSQGRVPELWLIPPGGSPKSLGLVSNDHSQTVKVPDALRAALAKGALLAVSLEPDGGAPQGVPTGPIIAKGGIVTL